MAPRARLLGIAEKIVPMQVSGLIQSAFDRTAIVIFEFG